MRSLDPRLLGLLALASLVAFLALVAGERADAQTFTKLTDPTNPVVTEPGSVGFGGASWVDADGNGWPDLFVVGRALFLNDGGAFTRVAFADSISGLGHSWADYDNDGDPDLMIAGTLNNGGRGTRLFRNDGGNAFTRVFGGGAIGDSAANVGWSCAWGDYDADGFVDLVVAQAQNFTGSGPNRLLHNQGDGTFVSDLTTDVTVGNAPYTVPQWCDFDLDGDLDLAIGAGPANGSKGPDYFYRNLRIEGGAPPLLDRVTTGILATELRDGQIIQWPDYDNDGDLDCFITNYRNSANHLYRNDGGVYVKMTGATAGPIASDVGWNLSSAWNDYDNDGDLDCYVVRTSAFANRYYRNEGNGTFTSLVLGGLTGSSGATAAAADFDRDGDVDLYVLGAAIRGLYLNAAPPENHWFEIRLVGSASNRSAIGARLRLTATIGGTSVSQLREVSSQNCFNGHSDYVQHVGLGDAGVVDQLVVTWPSGLVESFTNLPADTMLTLVEGEGFPTPTSASLVDVQVNARGVELEWFGHELEGAAMLVYRRPRDGAWAALGAPTAYRGGLAKFTDADARPGTWAYRLGVPAPGADAGAPPAEWLTEEAWVHVPSARAALQARARVAFGRPVVLEFTLPKAGEARLDVFDARGRRLGGERLGALAAGSHRAELATRLSRPGLYWVRLSQGGEAVTARALVLGEPR
jgi:hypothetical protein